MSSSIETKTLTSGIYVPTLTFFKEDQDQSIDVERCVEHSLSLAKAGIVGLVIQGSTGEAVCLTRDERKTIIRSTREALDRNKFERVVIVAGIGGQCVREALNYAEDAHAAGASFALALSPSYFVTLLSETVLFSFFTELADRSPIPILLYNFPRVSNGIDLSAKFLASMSAHTNIVGTKLTCNTISKMQYLSPDASNLKGPFQVLTGSSAFLPAGHAVKITGPITGVGNLFPYTLVRLWKLVGEGQDRKEINRLQNMITNYEDITAKGFIPALRASLEILGKPAGHSRRPIPDATKEEMEFYKGAIKEIAEEENRLASA